MSVALEVKISQHIKALHDRNFPGFGHALKPFYGFAASYVPFNNGSFGACPNFVMDIYRELLVEAELRPDTFLRKQYKPLLDESRRQVAELVNCPTDDLVLVPNATMGVNAVLRGLNGTWKKRDAILVFDTVYGACGKSAQYIIDSNPTFDLRMVTVKLTYPIKHGDLLNATQSAIETAQHDGLRIRVGILDAISSQPGVRVPWEEICKLFRSYEILSLVDGAHAVGQIPLDLSQTDPDFFISNCHKWLSAHRGVAFLYVPKRNQHIPLGIPTSHDYESPNLPKPLGPALIPTAAPSNFIAIWEWTGTQDLSNFLSLSAALEWRKWMGGEHAIMSYTSSLAKKGAGIVAQKLGHGSRIMDFPDLPDEQRLTVAMANVSVPIRMPANTGAGELPFVAAKLQTALMSNFDTFLPFYVHDAQVWIRISAQVWLEESDFVWLADRILDVLQTEGFQVKASM